MKRYYYEVQGFGPDFEHELGYTQYNNDRVFIKHIIANYILSSNHPQYEGNREHSDLLGHLDFHFFNWKGDKIDWLNHTITLFKEEKELLEEENEYVDYINFDELQIAIRWLEDRREPFIKKEPGDSLEKIKWNGKAAQIGYLFKELVDKGWITVPKTNQKESVKKLSRLCLQYFDVKTKSSESFYHEFLSFNSLSPMAKYFFKLKKFKES